MHSVRIISAVNHTRNDVCSFLDTKLWRVWFQLVVKVLLLMISKQILVFKNGFSKICFKIIIMQPETRFDKSEFPHIIYKSIRDFLENISIYFFLRNSDFGWTGAWWCVTISVFALKWNWYRYGDTEITWLLWKTKTKAAPAAVSPHVNNVPNNVWKTAL